MAPLPKEKIKITNIVKESPKAKLNFSRNLRTSKENIKTEKEEEKEIPKLSNSIKLRSRGNTPKKN